MGAVLIAGLLIPASVQAQISAPSVVGAARIPDPIPCSGPEPNVVPGPLTARQAPPGPPDCLSLSSTHSSAFQCEYCAPECAVYAHLGAIALTRAHLGTIPLVVEDPQNRDIGNLAFGLANPFQKLPVVLDAKTIPEAYTAGAQATLGILYNDQAVEVTGFYIPDHTRNADRRGPNGRNDVLVSGDRFGFTGDNGLWLQADSVRASLGGQLANGEINFRCNNIGIQQAELIVGARYVYYDESFRLFTDDDGLTFPDILGRPDPKRQATISARALNQIIAPQCGVEYGFLVCPWLSFGGTGKVALGADNIHTTYTLTRGDGFIGFVGRRNDVVFSQVYDANLWFDLHLAERIRVRAAYNAFFMSDIQPAAQIFDMNLQDTVGRKYTHGSVFYHGPSLEFQFLF
jgi:hypothetical protein